MMSSGSGGIKLWVTFLSQWFFSASWIKAKELASKSYASRAEGMNYCLLRRIKFMSGTFHFFFFFIEINTLSFYGGMKAFHCTTVVHCFP